MAVHGSVLDDLVAAAEEGVSYDGLDAERTVSGYRIETPAVTGAELDESAFRETAGEAAPWVTNWHFFTHGVETGAEARLAFLHWVERASEHDVAPRYDALADGLTREWGQLSIRATRDSRGHRQYDLRHREDAGVAPEALDTYEDPLAARELVKHDDDGRYRPLKTAPTLPTGWVYPSLSADELLETVGFVYPATVENWHREREGGLDVTHWTDCAERQTGIYDIIEELPREAVDWVAEACCADSECLKRREWQYDEDDDLAVDGGDGVFPCREPCSLVTAAARKWTTLESEEPREYTLELTLSEKNQLEELVDAVADGRVDDIREADVYEGANRYRVRYLRAKLFDEEGSLPTVE
ncbi:MAG: DR2241 family protein [Halovenus sp.]